DPVRLSVHVRRSLIERLERGRLAVRVEEAGGPAVLRGELAAGGDSANVQIVRDTSRREEAVPQTPWCRSLYQLSVFDDRCHEWSLPSVSGERGRSRDDTTAPVQSGGSGLDRASGVDLSGRRTGGAQAGGVLAQRSARVH